MRNRVWWIYPVAAILLACSTLTRAGEPSAQPSLTPALSGPDTTVPEAVASSTIPAPPAATATAAASPSAPPMATATATPAALPSFTSTAPPAPLPSVTAAAQRAGGPAIAGCPIFPSDHIWNTPVDSLPVDPMSAAYIASIGVDTPFHPDFGAGLYEGSPIGIPFTVAGADTPLSQVSFEYADESDPGPYPIPAGAPIEGGVDSQGDRHILIVEASQCRLYELYAAYPNGDGSWRAGSGAIWDLRGYALRPAGWTSADAAGLPILPGLARFDEIAAGAILHALRFTAEHTRNQYIWPARHAASDSDSPALPSMGQRFRLKAAFDISPFPGQVQILLRAMQRYGLILADNGGNWYVGGAPDDRWNNDTLVESFKKLKGGDFEAVDVAGLMRQADSGQAK